ncbi:hypothetical protein EKN06_06410 [Croceicoccus ponticola]|uniref:Uncharacterized protein n=1 Tax=Croceicoccus ponticola TaxID=2217664 RepID=A0A437GY43_9SPHN|nr:hypothetical protein [Croceicoccus ponticola]RVQ67578.1 hypothetical protein EKN06_06410 [Croceicoccus ponticola]
MGLIKIATLGALGYAGYKYYQGQRGENLPAAYAKGGPTSNATTTLTPVRDAGVDAMRDTPQTWSKTDQAIDESFPASDPSGNY